MSRKTIFLAVNGIGLILVILLFTANDANVLLKVAGSEIPATAGALIFGAYLTGALLAIASGIPMVSGMQAKSVERLKEWQQQDVKLVAELQSDREKQLEKKIETLEAALKQALKR